MESRNDGESLISLLSCNARELRGSPPESSAESNTGSSWSVVLFSTAILQTTGDIDRKSQRTVCFVRRNHPHRQFASSIYVILKTSSLITAVMTEIIVTLENDADINLLSKMIENMKGVLKASVRRNVHKGEKDSTEEWIKKMKQLSDSIDPSIVDMTDERTRYIMSK